MITTLRKVVHTGGGGGGGAGDADGVEETSTEGGVVDGVVADGSGSKGPSVQ